MKNRSAISALVGAALVLAGCGNDGGSGSDTGAGLCTALTALRSTVNQVVGTGADPDSTTVGDVQDDLSSIQSAVRSVQDAGSEVSDSVKSELQDAFDNFRSALDGISSDDTLSEAGDAVESAQSQFQQAWSDTLSQLNCSTSSPTP